MDAYTKGERVECDSSPRVPHTYLLVTLCYLCDETETGLPDAIYPSAVVAEIKVEPFGTPLVYLCW
jgi:hypothetical protein